MKQVDENILEFLSEMEVTSSDLDTALQDYGHMLEDTELEQAYSDWRDSRLAIVKTLRRIARENDLNEALDLL